VGQRQAAAFLVEKVVLGCRVKNSFGAFVALPRVLVTLRNFFGELLKHDQSSLSGGSTTGLSGIGAPAFSLLLADDENSIRRLNTFSDNRKKTRA
jgi:hypothetical protein